VIPRPTTTASLARAASRGSRPAGRCGLAVALRRRMRWTRGSARPPWLPVGQRQYGHLDASDSKADLGNMAAQPSTQRTTTAPSSSCSGNGPDRYPTLGVHRMSVLAGEHLPIACLHLFEVDSAPGRRGGAGPPDPFPVPFTTGAESLAQPTTQTHLSHESPPGGMIHPRQPAVNVVSWGVSKPGWPAEQPTEDTLDEGAGRRSPPVADGYRCRRGTRSRLERVWFKRKRGLAATKR